MADLKISALTGATTPLAGTEVLPIVQGGATVKVAVSNLTAGRAVSTGALTSSSVTTSADVEGLVTFGRFSAAYPWVLIRPTSTATGIEIRSNAGDAQLVVTQATGNVSVSQGNLVIGTSGKGIDFSATSHPAGMTSELLADYEDGTWTPDQGAGLTVIGAFSSAGRYTKIGRLVTLSGYVQGGTTVAVSSGNALTSNLPFTAGANGVGVMIANNQSLGGQLVAAGTDIYTTGMTAVVAIYFTVTYSV